MAEYWKRLTKVYVCACVCSPGGPALGDPVTATRARIFLFRRAIVGDCLGLAVLFGIQSNGLFAWY